jgi:hypothetical protein
MRQSKACGKKIEPIVWPGLRYSHQIPAAITRQVPMGSGTKNAPSVASASGEFISRNIDPRTDASSVGPEGHVNKLLNFGRGRRVKWLTPLCPKT